MAEISRLSIALKVPGSPQLHPFQPNSVEYRYIASAVNIGLSILEQDRSIRILASIASQFDNSALDSASFGNNEVVARRWTSWFVTQLKANTPTVIVDETLNNLDILGHHPRMHWIGRLDQFPFRRQRFQLNAQRVRSMVAAGNGTSDAKRQRFRNFQFAFATVVVHELGGRMLITWLSKGRQGIPGIISAAIYDNGVSMEEAGPCLETRLFGGTTKFYRDPRQDDDQAGVPYQIDENGWGWRINPHVINRVCNYEFTFPFARTGDVVDPREMQSMARCSDSPAL